MAWINEETGKMYYAGSTTILHDNVLFFGVPTSEQLIEWGYTEYTPPELPEPTPEDELDAYEALQIITGKEEI